MIGFSRNASGFFLLTVVLFVNGDSLCGPPGVVLAADDQSAEPQAGEPTKSPFQEPAARDLPRREAEVQGADAAEIQFHQGVLIHFEGMITPLLEQAFYRKLAIAEELQADLLIIQIDSPGGMVDPSFNIAHRLRDIDWATTIAYIPEEALSGAAVVSLGCDEIYMQPNAVIGDVGVITMGEDSMFRYAEEKIRTHVATQLRNLAEAKGRPTALAEAMVNMDLVVYEVTNRQTGGKTFMSEDEIAASAEPEIWEKGKPVLESREKQFFEVNGRRAVELHLAKGTVQDLGALKKRIGVAGDLKVLKPNGVDTAVFILNLPFITGLLFVIGMVALYVEFSAPGIGVGGLISVLCFSLFFWSRFLGGTAEVLEVVLFLAGVLFVAAELFVIPGFGVAGITGLLLMGAGVVMASQDFIIPETPRQVTSLSTSMFVLTCSAFTFLIAISILSRYFGALPFFNRLILKPASVDSAVAQTATTEDGKPLPVARLAIDVGDWGVAQTPLRPAGKAQFGDELLDVMTDGSFVESGSQIRIVEIQGSRVIVAEISE